MASDYTGLKFGITDFEPKPNSNTTTEMDSAEKMRVRERRRAYELTHANEDENAVGLALSGGGIRSATLSLGVIQVLEEQGLLKEVDFLSTVSGGGYTGGFLSSYLRSREEEVTLN